MRDKNGEFRDGGFAYFAYKNGDIRDWGYYLCVCFFLAIFLTKNEENKNKQNKKQKIRENNNFN